MAEMSIVAHHVPEQRAFPDHGHGLWPARNAVAHSHTEATAEKNDLHGLHLTSANLELWNREDEPPSPRPDIFEMLCYLLPAIPGEHENVIGPCLAETLTSENG